MIPDPCAAPCEDRCYPDPPCYVMHERARRDGEATGPWKPCAECLLEAGVEFIDPSPPDPAAVIRPLL